MDQSIQSISPKRSIKLQPNTVICLEQNINLPSNLLQKRKNILQQMRMLKTCQNSRINTSRQPIALMSKTFAHYQNSNRIQDNKLQMLIQQNPIKPKTGNKSKKSKNPLYRRLCDIQSQSKELSGVSFSKLLSRMLVIQAEQQNQKKQFNDYRKKNYPSIDTKLRSIPNYECLESKLFTIQCPQKQHESLRTSPKKSINLSPTKTGEPTSNKLFRRYFNPHGQKSDLMTSSETVQFDQRYIYRNGKKTECKRIHNFYTSTTFRKSYQKHMRNTIDTFYPCNRNLN